MEGLEITVMLGIAVLAGAVLAPRFRVAAPLLLLIFGLALGFVPALREIELPPETVLLLFLPVMLFWEGLTTSPRSVKRDFRGIVIMSTLLVVVTAFAVAGVAHLLGMPWQAALIVGGAVAPPDATAVAALGRTASSCSSKRKPHQRRHRARALRDRRRRRQDPRATGSQPGDREASRRRRDRRRERRRRYWRTHRCDGGVVDDSIARHIQTRLDIEELRLTSVEPLD